MKARLYDNEKIELPLLKTFNERVKYINDKILIGNDKKKVNTDEEQLAALKYKRYYNICATDLSSQEIKDIEKWWLGVKKVNQPLPIEIIKTTLDYLTGYILGSNDFSIKPYINRYLELKKKHKNSKLNEKDKQEYYDLKSKVIYEDKGLVFLDNHEMENQLIITLQNLNNIKFKNETDNFMICNIENRLEDCKKHKKEVIKFKEDINNLFEEKCNINATIKTEYKLFQETKDKNCLENILRLANKIKEINKDINGKKIKIQDEYNKYLICTEFIYKTK